MHGKLPPVLLDSFWWNMMQQLASRQLDIEDKVLLATSSQPCVRGDGL